MSRNQKKRGRKGRRSKKDKEKKNATAIATPEKGTVEQKNVKKVFFGPVPADCSDLGLNTKPEYVVPSPLLRRKDERTEDEDGLVCPICKERLVMTPNGEWVCPKCGLVVRQATLEEFTGEMEIGGEAYPPNPEKIEKYVAFSYNDRDLFVILNAVFEEIYGKDFDYLTLISIKESIASRWNEILKRWADEWPEPGCNVALLYKSLAEIFIQREAEKLGLTDEMIEVIRNNINKKLSKVRPWELRFRCSSTPRGDEERCRKWLEKVLNNERT